MSATEQLIRKKKFAELLLKCKDSAAEFARIFLHYEPYPYNAGYLDSTGSKLLYRSGRKAGKSRSTASKALHYGWFAPLIDKMVTNRCDILGVAPTLPQAQIIFEEIRTMAHIDPMLESFIVKETALEMHLRFINNGGLSRIMVRPAGRKGVSLRGYNPSVVIVDEASFVPRAVLVALLPAGSRQNAKFWFTSTPFGDSNEFSSLCRRSKAMCEIPDNICGEEKPPVWQQYYASTEDNPDITAEYLSEMRRIMSKDEYDQEVRGLFVGSGNALIPRPLLTESLDHVQFPARVSYSMGVDIAGEGKDSTVFVVGAYTDKHQFYGVESVELGNTTMRQVAEKASEIYLKYHGQMEVYADQTGLGLGAVENMLEHNIPVNGITFSPEEKIRLYNDLVKLFEDKTIHLGNMRGDTTKMIYQLSYLKKEQNEYKKSRIVSEAHDDYPDALALACRPLGRGESWSVMHDLDSIF